MNCYEFRAFNIKMFRVVSDIDSRVVTACSRVGRGNRDFSFSENS